MGHLENHGFPLLKMKSVIVRYLQAQLVTVIILDITVTKFGSNIVDTPVINHVIVADIWVTFCRCSDGHTCLIQQYSADIWTPC